MLIESALAQASLAGVALVVTPEMGAVGLLRADELEDQSDLSDGPLAGELAALCRTSGVGLVVGYVERCSGRLHSSALVIDHLGHAVGNYRRTHRAPGDQSVIADGQWLSIVPVSGRRVGLLIGADLDHPEAARALALGGADLLVALGALDGRDEAAAVLLAARRLENRVPVAAAWYDADMDPSMPRLVTLEVGPASAEAAARARLLAARRPRLYARLGVVDDR